MGHRVLIVTEDRLSPAMAGPAIRAWQMAGALADHGHQVVLATTVPSSLSPSGFTIETVDERRVAELERWCEVLVIQGYVLHRLPVLRSSDKILVCDLYDPLHLEVLELTAAEPEPERSTNVANAVATLAEHLRRGDFFLCAGSKQRDLWLGFLAAEGRVNADNYDRDPTLRSLVSDVPFGRPDDPPVRTRAALRGAVPGIDAGDQVVLWGGGVYDWLDPETLVRAADGLRTEHPRLRVFFLGVRHPNPAVEPARTLTAARQLSDALELTGSHVFFNDSWVAYDDRQNYLLDADVGVSLHLEHLETAFSFRARVVDYLWAGLPIVCSAGDGFADLVAAEGLGVVVPPRDPVAVADALHGLLADPEHRRRVGERVAHVGDRFRWSAVLDPVIRFCDDPRRAADVPQWPTPDDDGATEVEDPVVAGWWAGAKRDLRTASRLARQGGAAAIARAARDRLVRSARRSRHGPDGA
ncbi:MAG TPA: glycosyltransferase [Acidimicrobiales bacterium]|nr:glycosyltransferase [Acidimicrobiales bacterium]